MSRKTTITLSVSAVTAALSALAQASHSNPDMRIVLNDPAHGMTSAQKDAFEPQKEAIRAAFVGIKAESQLRANMGTVFPHIDFDPETMEEAWIRLASSNYSGVIERGNTSDNQIGRLLGPNSDSTLNDNNSNANTTPGIETC